MSAVNVPASFHPWSGRYLVIFPLLGGALCGICIGLLKHVIVRTSQEKAATRPKMFSQPIWWLGAVGFYLGTLVISVADFDDNSRSINDLMSFGTGWLMSILLLKEPMRTRDHVAYWIIVLGCGISFFTIDTLSPTVAAFAGFTAGMGFCLFVAVIVLLFLRKRRLKNGLSDPRSLVPRKVLPLLYATIVASIYVMLEIPYNACIITQQPASTILVLYWIHYFIRALVKTLWIIVAVSDYDVVYVLPNFFFVLRLVDYIMTASYDGFNDFVLRQPALYIALPLIGMAVAIGGLFQMSQRESYSAYHTLITQRPKPLPEPPSRPPKVKKEPKRVEAEDDAGSSSAPEKRSSSSSSSGDDDSEESSASPEKEDEETGGGGTRTSGGGGGDEENNPEPEPDTPPSNKSDDDS